MALWRITVGALAALAVIAPAPAEAALISQGAVRMGADALWSEGILGQGQVVAILDEGFAGLDRSIELGELPPREALVLQSFDPDNGLDGLSELGLVTQHGVRMAELVHDLAPQARLLLVQYHTQAQFAQASDWAVAQGAHVVSHSNSFLTPPFDGTGPAARVVDRAAAAGVLWVNSAGNFAQRHWTGVAEPGGTVIPIAPRPGEPLSYSLTWRDPAVAASVAIERQDGAGAWVEVARSTPDGARNAQTALVLVDGGSWRLVVRQPEGPPAPLRLFSRTVGFGGLATAAGSVPTPGDAAGSLTVGAVRWTGAARAPYSSFGPTESGLAKPELVAPTYVTSNPEWPGTAGTSAAAAHVAGAAALMRQARLARGQSVSVPSLRAALTHRALDLGAPGVDPVYGAGQLRLDRERPTLRLWLRPGARPSLRVRVSDRGTLRELRVTVNGRPLRTVRRPRLRLSLPRLAPGRHVVRVSAEDMAGNVATRTRVVRVGGGG